MRFRHNPEERNGDTWLRLCIYDYLKFGDKNYLLPSLVTFFKFTATFLAPFLKSQRISQIVRSIRERSPCCDFGKIDLEREGNNYYFSSLMVVSLFVRISTALIKLVSPFASCLDTLFSSSFFLSSLDRSLGRLIRFPGVSCEVRFTLSSLLSCTFRFTFMNPSSCFIFVPTRSW